MTTQRYEIEAWLGDDHGLTDEQVTDLIRISDEINERYPDEDDADLCDAAMVAAYRILSGHDSGEDIVAALAETRVQARKQDAEALAGLRQAAAMLVPDRMSENGFARIGHVDRMTVRRKWLGKD